MNKILSTIALIICFCIFLISPNPVTAEPSDVTIKLTDLDGHWAVSEIKNAVKAGYANGYSDRTFKPDASITEEEFLSMVVRAVKLPINAQPSNASWFTPYYEAAKKNGIYHDDYRSDWSKPLTRGDAAQTLVRATQAVEKNRMLARERSQQEGLIMKPEELKTLQNLPNFRGQTFGNINDVEETPQLIKELQVYWDELIVKFKTNKTEGTYCIVKQDKSRICYLQSDAVYGQVVAKYIDFLQSIVIEVEEAEKKYTYNKIVFEATKRGLLTGIDAEGDLALKSTLTRAQAVVGIERMLAFNQGTILTADKHAMSRAELLWHGTNVFTMWPRYFPERFIDSFDIGKGKWDSPDGIYHEQLLEFIVVDVDDPHDPFKAETEGMLFSRKAYDSNENRYKFQTISAPNQSYISYSKVKQELTGPYPSWMTNAAGGRAQVNISPIDESSKTNAGIVINPLDKFIPQESDDHILYSKIQIGQNEQDLNIKKGYNPSRTVLQTGETYYWVAGQLHPKGDMSAGILSDITFTPNSYYRYQSYGKNGGNASVTLIRAKPNLEVHNER
ncbi:S-layer homology domain-containing protein [Paenibacillus sp. HWE-109]|uniref:S-layer homology domain-containing protein n=1 Tax=Paenibacillus sp. HWE-109 TaxID=1306526 RepID=UPI001EDE9A68|nr:S-layer homology domain-containing protein [Paenibacillus sp. HWE-109]UKS31039.1 S-layer homology domain-containing protein [Paenibacillus sp. HWE-109]